MNKFVVEQIPVTNIIADRNIRSKLDDREQAELAESIRQNGLLVPLLGHREGDRIVVADGHRRFDAAVRAGRVDVPMIVSDRAPTPAERIALMLVVNTQRVDLKVMERARAIDQLRSEMKWTAAEVSEKLGSPSPASISKLQTLLVLSRETQDLIDAGLIPMSSAYALATVEDAAERQRFLNDVLNGGLTRDKLAALTKSHRAARRSGYTRPRARRPRVARIVFPIGPGRRIAVSAPDLSVESVTKWIGDLLVALRKASAGGLALGDLVAQLSGKGAS